MKIENAIVDFIKVCELANIQFNRTDIEDKFLYAGREHVLLHPNLPKGYMAVYIFTDTTGDHCYKVGKVGPKSNARFQSQHYSPKRSKSNLANSFKNDEEFKDNEGLQNNTSEWIKHNTNRVNLLLKAEKGIATLNLLEAFMQSRLRPKYEGFESQKDLKARRIN